MISKSHRFIFIHNPKTAGNSITAFLLPYLEYESFINNEIRHSYTKSEMKESEEFVKKCISEGYIQSFPHRYEVINRVGSKYASMKDHVEKWPELVSEYGELDEYFKFAVKRNPWDRSLSFYLSPHRETKEFNKDAFLKCLNEEMPTFGSKVSRTGSLKDMKDDDVTYFVDFYNLKEGISEVCEQVGLEQIKHLSRLNISRLKKENWKAQYDEEMYEAVLKKHKEEIEFFGYEF